MKGIGPCDPIGAPMATVVWVAGTA
jgi:hypothetical protein